MNKYYTTYEVLLEILNKIEQGVGGLTPEQEALLNYIPALNDYVNYIANSKMDQVRLITDGSVITDVDGNILTFNDIYNLVMDNSKYVYIVMYNNIRFRVSAYDGDAIWFDSTFIEEGKPNILRCIINSDNQVSVDQIVVASEDYVDKKVADFIFVGTHSQWESLPEEEKAKYTLTLLTD